MFTADTVPGRTLCRLSPSGARVARITSRAGIRTRTVVPARGLGPRRAACLPRTSARAGHVRIWSYPTRLEDTAEADGLPQPRQVRAAHQDRPLPGGDRAAVLEDQDMRGQPHHVVEIVGDEHERAGRASGAARRSRPAVAVAPCDRRRQRVRRGAARPARGPAPARAPRADARRPRAHAAGDPASDRCTRSEQLPPPATAARRAGDARARPPRSHRSQVREERVLLEHEADGAAMGRMKRTPRCRVQAAAGSDRRMRRPVEPGDRAGWSSCRCPRGRRWRAPRRGRR